MVANFGSDLEVVQAPSYSTDNDSLAAFSDEAESDSSTRRLFSWTWLSDKERELEKYRTTIAQLTVLAPTSVAVPWTWEEWLEHRLAVLVASTRKLEARIDSQARHTGKRGRGPVTLNRVAPDDGLSAVLLMPTVWCVGAYNYGRPLIPWPSQAELEWEGSERARSGVGRFLPLLRLRANNTVAWHLLPVFAMLDFDRVGRVPTTEDTSWSAYADSDAMEHVIGSNLWEAIEACGTD